MERREEFGEDTTGHLVPKAFTGNFEDHTFSIKHSVDSFAQ
jgi:hypothetical protein